MVGTTSFQLLYADILYNTMLKYSLTGWNICMNLSFVRSIRSENVAPEERFYFNFPVTTTLALSKFQKTVLESHMAKCNHLIVRSLFWSDQISLVPNVQTSSRSD